MRKKIAAQLSKFQTKAVFQSKTVLWIAIGGLFILLGASKWLYSWLSNPGFPPAMPIQAQTIQVKQASMPELVETVGSMKAKTELTLKAVSPGRVQELVAESGSWVKKGSLLANIVGAPELRAPFDGYLTDWKVDAGEYVTTGQEFIELVNTDFLLLTYRVPEPYAGKLDLNQAVEVVVKAFPDQVFQGSVKFISPIVDKKTYTILVRAEIKNSDQNLWPGMSAHVRQILVTHPYALVIPEASLIYSLEGYNVFVIDPEGLIQRKSVQVGERRQGRAHILSGLTLGDTVILTRNNFIEEGKKAAANPWDGDW